MENRIIMDNWTCQFIPMNHRVHKVLDYRLAIRVLNYQFTTSYQRGTWDGKYHFYKANTGKFPTGLLQVVLSTLESINETATVIDKRIKPKLTTPICSALHGIDLRSYQIEAAARILEAARCIVKAATNAGKTEIMAEILRKLNLPSLVLVHRKELLYQTAERLSLRLGVPIGMIGDGIEDIKRITVCMPQTVVKSIKDPASGSTDFIVNAKFKKLFDCAVLILDECHNLPDTRILHMVKRSIAYYRIAMSGTPLLNSDVDNHMLRGQFGEIAFEITNAELISLGVSSVPTCQYHRLNQEGLETASWKDAYKKGIVNSDKRNNLIASMAQEHGKKLSVLIIVKDVQHGHQLCRKIPQSSFIHGSLPSEMRMNAIKAFKDGRINMLISTVILDEGVDISNIDVLILAAGGKAPKRVLQRVGRGLRKKESNKLLVIDFLDTGNLYLIEHSQERVNTLKQEGFAVQLAQ